MHKRLILRLSSLGDVILATSSLEVTSATPMETHWVTTREFAPLLENHPKISKLWVYDRRKSDSSLKNWLKFADEIYAQDFNEVIDLHRSLRTRIFMAAFRLKQFLGDARAKNKIQFRTLQRQKFKLIAFFFFKSLWPKVLRPQPLTYRMAKSAGGSGSEKPSLKHLTQVSGQPIISKNAYAFMPASAWPGKQWPVDSWVKLIEAIHAKDPAKEIHILGTSSDQASVALVEKLKSAGIHHFDHVGKLGLKETAALIGQMKTLFAGDTGLLHLSESLGVPVRAAFGPTHPEMGFGPWRKESQVIQSKLWCRPCSKDGSACFRLGEDRYQCMKSIEVKDWLSQVPS